MQLPCDRLHVVCAMRLFDSQTKVKRTTSRAHVNNYKIKSSEHREVPARASYVYVYLYIRHTALTRVHVFSSRPQALLPGAAAFLTHVEAKSFFFSVHKERGHAGTQTHAHYSSNDTQSPSSAAHNSTSKKSSLERSQSEPLAPTVRLR